MSRFRDIEAREDLLQQPCTLAQSHFFKLLEALACSAPRSQSSERAAPNFDTATKSNAAKIAPTIKPTPM